MEGLFIRAILILNLFSLIILTVGCAYYSVPKPQSWSQDIKLDKDFVSETTRVSDWSSEVTLFWFHDAPSAYPVDVKRVDSEHWIVIFEKPSNVESNVSIEQINKNEWKVSIKK